MDPYTEFSDYVAEINDLLCVINLLNWDANSNMPPAGSKTRGLQLATLTKLTQERLTSEQLGNLLIDAERAIQGEPTDSYRVRAVAQTRQAYDTARRIPAQILAEHAANRSLSELAWARAKEEDDFAVFAPYLKRSVELNRAICDAIGYADHPYDALLQRTETGMTVSQLKPLLNDLHAVLTPLLAKITASRDSMPVHILHQPYPVEAQKAFCYQLAEMLGYDLKRGHFGLAPHPFEISFTSQDVRITNRYKPNFIAGGLFGMLHETGHALYEQGVAPELARTALATDFLSQYAVGGVTFGMHESQSRLWENQIGRSRPFWELHFPALQQHFPDALGSVDAETFYRAINHVAPSLIRVEADEVTYNFHIMLRVELEMGLLDGTIEVDELPIIWNEKMAAYLGLTPPTDREGVLQDIHWAFGQMGTFPAYTLGNIMSAQYFKAAHEQLDGLSEQLVNGNYHPLHQWLREELYQHGRAYSPDELLHRTTGQGIQVGPYAEYLTRKYGDLYGFDGGES